MGEQKRREREALVAKALLLGYELKWGVFSEKACYMLMPNGMYYAENKAGDSGVSTTRYSIGTPWRPVAFPAAWVAAAKALELSGVVDASKPPRDTGTGSGKDR